MSQAEEMIRKLESPEATEQLRKLYGSGEETIRFQRERYARLIRSYEEQFGAKDGIRLISAPGRTEIGGNHTDHNRGRVLAAAVSLDTLCAVTPRDDLKVCFRSEGYPAIEMDLTDLAVHPDEAGTTAALIRGVAAGMKEAGYRIGGFDAAVTSTVAGGSGLSSSAALEVMLTGVLDALYNRFDMPYALRARISQKAENAFFGKPSGLLDQMASAAGGLVTVDFRDTDKPEARALQYDFAKKGYSLVVVATGGSHADLTDCYAAIPAEMKAVAAYYGKPYLRGLTAEQLIADMDSLRKQVSDRALIRAFHFILCMAEQMLRGRGAWRIHGGGFAGTTLNFVPEDLLTSFTAAMDRTFGRGAAIALGIRPVGAAELKL